MANGQLVQPTPEAGVITRIPAERTGPALPPQSRDQLRPIGDLTCRAARHVSAGAPESLPLKRIGRQLHLDPAILLIAGSINLIPIDITTFDIAGLHGLQLGIS